jgi:hypothetical protein
MRKPHHPSALWPVTGPHAAQHLAVMKGSAMNRVTLIAIAAAAFALLGTTEHAAAVVYCKTVGVPKGCVVRPAPVVRVATPVVRPVTRAAVGVGVNRGGPVNRRGVR